MNYLVKKVTFGYVDLKQTFGGLVHQTKLKNHLVYYKEKTYWMVQYSKRKIATFLSKHQDKDQYNEFLQYRKLIESKIDEESKRRKGFFRNMRFFKTINLLFSNKLGVMNRYVKSSYFTKIFYELKYRSEEDVKDFRKNPFGYLSHKVLNFFSLKTFLNIGSTKQRLKALAIKLAILYLTIMLIKLGYYRISNRRVDRQYEDTLRLFKELKAQNEEILKNNQIIMEENLRLRGKKTSN